MTRYPIPDSALDDRLAILGTAGSGKTYLTLGAIERLLGAGARVVAVDPLGVMWGLRLKADGKTASGFNIPIFGGRHGDLPLTEHVGALIGETVATMRESCIVDMSELPTKAAERRFMTAFLEAIYRHTDPNKQDPYHLILDEADRFAPQKPPAGDETMLNRMEEIVRRGRVKGFIPWLITQRPAVLNKNVLSQADGLVMLKLTSSQDRDQVGAWIEGQADRAQGKAILGSLPAMQRGQGVVWIPGRGILEMVQFPAKATFDSSAAPKRGEKRDRGASLRPIDLGVLKERLASVEAETKANDPAVLKSEIRRLNAEIASRDKKHPSVAVEKINTADQKGQERALAAARAEGYAAGWADGDRDGFARGAAVALDQGFSAVRDALKAFAGVQFVPPKRAPSMPKVLPAGAGGAPSRLQPSPAPRPAITPSVKVEGAPVEGLTTPQKRILASLSFWASVGNEAPSRPQVAAVAGYTHTSGSFRNTISSLNVAGLIRSPDSGRLALVGTFEPMSVEEARAKLLSILGGPERKIVDALMDGETLTREEVGERVGYEPTSGSFRNTVSALNVLNVLTKPSTGTLAMTDWAREVLG